MHIITSYHLAAGNSSSSSLEDLDFHTGFSPHLIVSPHMFSPHQEAGNYIA